MSLRRAFMDSTTSPENMASPHGAISLEHTACILLQPQEVVDAHRWQNGLADFFGNLFAPECFRIVRCAIEVFQQHVNVSNSYLCVLTSSE